ncbi:MAG: sodium:solute symporter family protein [Longimicrobiales bacterium]
MNLHAIDLVIIVGYAVATLVIGLLFARRATRSMASYFLGGREIPWYMLGVSNASGMFDVSGTMWLVYLLFIYGLKSLWIPWLWPVFNQVFLMVFLSLWLRRSRVMTGAEWIRFRFGDARGAQLAHVVVVMFALFNVVGFLAYGFIGIGKFAAVFLPWQLSQDAALNAKLWGLLITAVTTVYVVKGGMISVVFTEVLQFGIMTLASIGVGVVAMQRVSPELLDRFVPDGWRNPFFGWTLDLDWSGIMDSANSAIDADGWSLFSVFFMLMLFKGLLQSGAGPAPSYDMQRILSTRSPREAAKMSGLVSVVLNFPRYMLVTGLTVLALVFFSGELTAMGDTVDFELILPIALREFVPIGLLGLLVAGMIAAFMSTYAATVNAAPAYVVNDIYKRYINPDAEDRVYIRVSYVMSLLAAVVGASVGWFVESLNDIVKWIVAALYGGYTASNLLKWYWWRFSSQGYFWGMAAGITAALAVPVIFTDMTVIYAFPIIFAVSLIGCIGGSLLTAPDDVNVLKNFYVQVRPWGFWGPIRDQVLREQPGRVPNRNFARDMFNVGIGMVWQTSMTASGIFLVLEDFAALSICVGLVLATSLILKASWYDRLEDEPADLGPVHDAGDATRSGRRRATVTAGAS